MPEKMNILKPRKSKFDEDLASRINKEGKKAAPEKRTVTPNPDELVDFCGTQIYKRELEAIREVYAWIPGDHPEDDYNPDDTEKKIGITNGHLSYLELMRLYNKLELL